MKIFFCIPLIALTLNAHSQNPIKVNTSSATVHGPEKGTLIIIGGNVGDTPEIWNKFVELAGGKDKAKIVVITAASGDSAAFRQKDVDQIKKSPG